MEREGKMSISSVGGFLHSKLQASFKKTKNKQHHLHDRDFDDIRRTGVIRYLK